MHARRGYHVTAFAAGIDALAELADCGREPCPTSEVKMAALAGDDLHRGRKLTACALQLRERGFTPIAVNVDDSEARVAAVARPTFRSGQLCHQPFTIARSVVASRTPRFVIGIFSRGLHGKSGRPRFASARVER